MGLNSIRIKANNLQKTVTHSIHNMCMGISYHGQTSKESSDFSPKVIHIVVDLTMLGHTYFRKDRTSKSDSLNRSMGKRGYDGELDQSQKALGYGIYIITGIREISYEGTWMNNKKHGLCAYFKTFLIVFLIQASLEEIPASMKLMSKNTGRILSMENVHYTGKNDQFLSIIIFSIVKA